MTKNNSIDLKKNRICCCIGTTSKSKKFGIEYFVSARNLDHANSATKKNPIRRNFYHRQKTIFFTVNTVI
jgi:hypothetical protein